jgi:ubiquinone/menaquinone biosynthesis C-methylase UbiE
MSGDFRATQREQARIGDLFSHIQARGQRALDVGARDGHLSLLLAERFERVVALDLQAPVIAHPRVDCVAGDAARLDYPDDSFDLVLCSEVLEHVPGPALEAACREIVRVAADRIVIGVPLEQDLRAGETTCAACGRPNPPWGHVNSFSEARLAALFGGATILAKSYQGRADPRTNALSARLLRYAGNPFGTYVQDEPCVHCGGPIGQPRRRDPAQRLATRVATLLDRWLARGAPARPMWIHLLLRKSGRPARA